MPINVHQPPASLEHLFDFRKAVGQIHEEYRAHIKLQQDFITLHNESLSRLRDEYSAEVTRHHDQESALRSDIDRLTNAAANQSSRIALLEANAASLSAKLADAGKSLSASVAAEEASNSRIAEITASRWFRLGRRMRLIR